MTDPSVLTIILNFRTPELTLKALDAALREMAGIRGEILVVDNGSGDDSCEVLTRGIEGLANPPVPVRFKASARNGGFGAGNNFGMHAGLSDGTQPDFYYILNSDAFPQKGAIRNLIAHMQTHRHCGIAGSAIRGVDGEPHQTAFRFPTIAGEFEGAIRTGIFTRLLRNSVVPLPLPDSTIRVDWVAGASALLRRRMLDEIGLFDETFFLYFEETDLCLRAARAGWETWYVRNSEVLHEGSSSTGMKLWKRTPRYWFDSRLHYFTKNHGRAYAAGATLARLTGALLWRTRAILSRRSIGDPPHFLRDLVTHFAGNIRRRPDHVAATPMTKPLVEESK